MCECIFPVILERVAEEEGWNAVMIGCCNTFHMLTIKMQNPVGQTMIYTKRKAE